MSPERLIGRIKARQQKHSVDSLKKPLDKTEFEYGRASGFYLGLEEALNIILNQLEDDKNGRDDL